MIKQLISQFGKDRINSLTKYPSILTLHKMGEKGRLMDELSTPVVGENMFATEKIDGTNVRIICYGNEYLIGSREFILTHSDDLYFDPSQGIVDSIKQLFPIPTTDFFTVFYGELYGGKVSSNSKWYGTDRIGFHLFDVAEFSSQQLLFPLSKPVEYISRWREWETSWGMGYGQPFLGMAEAKERFPYYEYVPQIDFNLTDTSHWFVLDRLHEAIPHTNVSLSESATNRAEGLVLRNADRSKIVKVRFEDYERTLRK